MQPNVQTSNGMALWLGIPRGGERAKVVEALVKNVESRGHHLSTGIIGTRVLLPSLPTETAYALAVQDTYPVSTVDRRNPDWPFINFMTETQSECGCRPRRWACAARRSESN
eukprot:SAG11_NODE_524_length_8751_cov_4.292765_7_plen_112_part_00